MNFIKIQNELLKACEKRNGYKKLMFPYHYASDEKNVYVTEGHKVWIIPQTMFYLDVNKVFADKTPLGETFIKGFIKEFDYDVVWTGTTQIIGDKQLNVFKCKGEVIYIDPKMLKDIDLAYCHFKGNDKNAPMQIYEGDNLVAIVLPVKVG